MPLHFLGLSWPFVFELPLLFQLCTWLEPRPSIPWARHYKSDEKLTLQGLALDTKGVCLLYIDGLWLFASFIVINPVSLPQTYFLCPTSI